jgi:hypothetical protein
LLDVACRRMYNPLGMGRCILKSIARLKTLGPFEVWLPNHPWMALPRDLEDIEKAMGTRGSGAHPAW